ncbi:ATP-binding protein [Candidatus Saccharibacteria bacterium]|nr:ATP-binding protein [Candidatus Saccharibacteria bacterium]
MYRTAIEDLKNWKKKTDRKPLIVRGARQVGKTWLVREFGKTCYEDMVYFNFEQDKQVAECFEHDLNPERILLRLSALAQKTIKPGSTLIFFDEIQECPLALTALKYFNENAPEYHIVVAGSLLGVFSHDNVSFPVGQVDFLDVFPMSFEEFLIGSGKKVFAKGLREKDFELLAPLNASLIELMKLYMVTGGMPEVVHGYLDDKDIMNVRERQNRILDTYYRDFSKHVSGGGAQKIAEIFNIIPEVLAKENNKFMFGAIKPSARAREYATSLEWLVGAGLATRVLRVNKIALPLRPYANYGVFKLFSLDVGLLGCQAGLSPNAILSDAEDYREFKGVIAEQFVLQEAKAHGVELFYYSKDDSRVEIDFIFNRDTEIIPVEVKSGSNLVSKSFNLFLEENKKIKLAYKLSRLPYKKNGRIVNLPLYFAGEM